MVNLRQRFNPAALLRFALGGVLSAGTTLGTTALFHELGSIAEHIAAAAGLAIALVVNFTVLRLFVFRASGVPVARQLLLFLGSSGVFRLFEYGAFLLLNMLLHVQYLVALVLVLGTSFLLKFVVFDNFIFRRS